MRLTVIVHHLVQVFTGNSHVVGQIVVTGGDNNLFGPVFIMVVAPVNRAHLKASICAGDRSHALVLTHFQPIMLGHIAVILQGLMTVGLLVGGGKGNVANFQ